MSILVPRPDRRGWRRAQLRVDNASDVHQAVIDGAGSFELVAVESIPRGTEVSGRVRLPTHGPIT
jgi:hypothetical protein